MKLEETHIISVCVPMTCFYIYAETMGTIYFWCGCLHSFWLCTCIFAVIIFIYGKLTAYEAFRAICRDELHDYIKVQRVMTTSVADYRLMHTVAGWGIRYWTKINWACLEYTGLYRYFRPLYMSLYRMSCHPSLCSYTYMYMAGWLTCTCLVLQRSSTYK